MTITRAKQNMVAADARGDSRAYRKWTRVYRRLWDRDYYREWYRGFMVDIRISKARLGMRS